MTALPAPDLGPCDTQPCTADAVAYVSVRPYGPSPQLTVITGEKARLLVDAVPEHSTAACADHAVAALECLLRKDHR